MKGGRRNQTPNSLMDFCMSSKVNVVFAIWLFASDVDLALACKFFVSLIILSICISSIAAASLCSR